MRRITIWLAGTLAVVALAIAFQLGAAGIGGKEGEENGGRPGEGAPGSAEVSATTPPADAPGSAPTPPPAGDVPAEEDKPAGGDTAVHEDKPGESR